MATSWMEIGRYGDTSVMHADGNRAMWPWRDWVINATIFNHLSIDRSKRIFKFQGLDQ